MRTGRGSTWAEGAFGGLTSPFPDALRVTERYLSWVLSVAPTGFRSGRKGYVR